MWIMRILKFRWLRRSALCVSLHTHPTHRLTLRLLRPPINPKLIANIAVNRLDWSNIRVTNVSFTNYFPIIGPK
jgi:hypothetical protein